MIRRLAGPVATAAMAGAIALLAAAPAEASADQNCRDSAAGILSCSSPAPEPGMLSLLALGVGGLAVSLRRK